MRSSAERRLRDLLEAAPDAIIEVDEDGQILLLNGMTEKLFGYQREELVGQPVEVLIPEDLRATHARNRSDYCAPQRIPSAGEPDSSGPHHSRSAHAGS